MDNWFTIDKVDEDTYIISEYRHWEETHCSLEKMAFLPAKKVLPGHHSMDIQPEIVIRMRDRFRELEVSGKLHHGSGTFDYGDWAVWL